MKYITLTNGELVQVSDEDFEFLNQFTWKAKGGDGRKKYASRNVRVSDHTDKWDVFMHKEVLKRMGTPVPDGMEGDHIDRDPLNNQRENLRVVTKSQNKHNATMQKNNTSGVRGVNFDHTRQLWRARIKARGRRIELGFYQNFDDAVEARRRAEKNYLGSTYKE